MDDGAANEPFDDAVGIWVDADFDSVLSDQSHVVVGDFIRGAVRQADAEWPERCGPKEFSDLFWFNHAISLAVLFGGFNPQRLIKRRNPYSRSLLEFCSPCIHK